MAISPTRAWRKLRASLSVPTGRHGISYEVIGLHKTSVCSTRFLIRIGQFPAILLNRETRIGHRTLAYSVISRQDTYRPGQYGIHVFALRRSRVACLPAQYGDGFPYPTDRLEPSSRGVSATGESKYGGSWRESWLQWHSSSSTYRWSSSDPRWVRTNTATLRWFHHRGHKTKNQSCVEYIPVCSTITGNWLLSARRS